MRAEQVAGGQAGVGCETLVASAAAIRAGRISSRALITRLLEAAAESVDLGGYITLAAEQALAAAAVADRAEPSGPLHGVPIVVKDNIHVAGLPNTAGTPALRGFIAPDDAPVVARLRAAGAIVLGKTNMHELAFGVTSNNAAYGSVRNAHDRTRFAGGSSGGTAALVGARVALAGLGTDTGGSVRIPAALNGVWGLRPTTGRYPAGGITLLSASRDVPGPIAGTVDDLELLDRIISGDREPPRPVRAEAVRLGIPTRHFTEPLDPGTAGVWELAKAAYSAAGVVLVAVNVDQVVEIEARTSRGLGLHEAPRELTAYLQHYLPGLTLDGLIAEIASPDVSAIFHRAIAPGAPDAVPVEVYERDLLPARADLQRTYSALFEDNQLDALAFPTTPLPAQPIDSSDEQVELAGSTVPTFEAFTRNTRPGSLAGIPGITIPVGATAGGLPVGLALDGPRGSDRRLIEIARALAQI